MADNRNIVIKHSTPSGAPKRKPSHALSAAMRQLAESEEIKCLIPDASANGRKVQLQVFHGGSGNVILIHVGAAATEGA